MSSITRDASDLERLREVAEEAVRVGSAVLLASPRPSEGMLERKGAGDWVTEVDRHSEEAIRDHLSRATPDIPVLGEEGGGGWTERFWAVDPLDATTNFMLGFPVVAVSVGLVEEGRPAAGAVAAPFLGRSFSAARGSGAWCQGRRLAVSERPPPRAVVAFGFPFRAKELLGRFRPALEHVFSEAEDLRRAGAAALDLAWVAAGVWDGYFELNLNIWDLAAGAVLVEEAGGVVTDWEGGDGYLNGDILAGSPGTHRLLLEAARLARDP